jgi:hypothetical protein
MCLFTNPKLMAQTLMQALTQFRPAQDARPAQEWSDDGFAEDEAGAGFAAVSSKISYKLC